MPSQSESRFAFDRAVDALVAYNGWTREEAEAELSSLIQDHARRVRLAGETPCVAIPADDYNHDHLLTEGVLPDEDEDG